MPEETRSLSKMLPEAAPGQVYELSTNLLHKLGRIANDLMFAADTALSASAFAVKLDAALTPEEQAWKKGVYDKAMTFDFRAGYYDHRAADKLTIGLADKFAEVALRTLNADEAAAKLPLRQMDAVTIEALQFMKAPSLAKLVWIAQIPKA